MITSVESKLSDANIEIDEGMDKIEGGVTAALQKLKRLIDFKQYNSAYDLCKVILKHEPKNSLLLEYKDVLERAKVELADDTESESESESDSDLDDGDEEDSMDEENGEPDDNDDESDYEASISRSRESKLQR